MEAGMIIAVARVKNVPISIDTPEDLERAREMLRESKSQ
jgi:CMP-2-keto-3-deoxyoctulosonic acid synthetase